MIIIFLEKPGFGQGKLTEKSLEEVKGERELSEVEALW